MPAKTIEFSDAEIVKLVLEFCERRELNTTMLALERESGIVNGQYSDDLLFLRQLILDGAWDDVIEFLQPLRGVEGFDASFCAYHVLKCKYLELLCVRAEDVVQQEALRKVNSETVRSGAFRKQNELMMQDLINCLQELEHVASKTDYSALCILPTLNNIAEHPAYANWTPLNGRLDCFRSILPIVEPFMRFDPTRLGAAAGSGAQSARSDRLVQLVVKGMLYEACIDFCQAKATQIDDKFDEQHDSQSPEDLFNIPDTLGTVHSAPIGETDFSLVSWLEALPLAIFNQPFEQRTFEVRRNALEKPAVRLDGTSQNNAAWLEQICMMQSAARPRHAATASSSQLPAARPTTASAGAALLLSRSFMMQHGVSDLEQLTAEVRSTTLDDNIDSGDAQVENASDHTAHFQNMLNTLVNRSIAQNGDDQPALFHGNEVTQVMQFPDDPASVRASSVRQNGATPFGSRPQTGQSQADVLVITGRPKTAAGPNPSTGSFARRPPTSGGVDTARSTQRGEPTTRSSIANPPNADLFSEYERHKQALQEQAMEAEIRRAEMLRQLNAANINSARQQAPMASISRDQGNTSARSSQSQNSNASANGGAGSVPRFIPVTVVEDQQAVRAIAWNPTGQYYAVGSNSRLLRICAYPNAVDSLRTDSLANALPANVVHKRSKYHRGSIYCLAWNGTGELIASGSNDKAIRLLRVDARSAKPLVESELTMHDGTVRDVVFLDEAASSASVTPTCLLLSAGAGDCKVYCTDCAAEGGARLARTFDGHAAQICSLFVVPTGGASFISGASDRTARFWDARTPEATQIVSAASPFASVCTDPAGRLLCAGHEDSSCSLFDIRGGRLLQTFKPHIDEVRSVRIANVMPPGAAAGSAGPFMLTGSYDRSVAVADLRGDLVQPLPFSVAAEHKDKVIQCRWHPTLPAFVSTSADKTAVCWCTP